MAVISDKRIRQTRKRRAVLGVVLAAWLSGSLQPCLMAMEMPPEPATSSAMSADHGSHGGHGNHSPESAAETIQDCVHCPPAAEVLSQEICESSIQADCDAQPAAKHDSRNPKLDTKDVDHSLDCLPASVYQAADLVYEKFLPMPQDKSIGPVGPSLSILFCRYLK